MIEVYSNSFLMIIAFSSIGSKKGYFVSIKIRNTLFILPKLKSLGLAYYNTSYITTNNSDISRKTITIVVSKGSRILVRVDITIS
jgi:hypothetical protein